MRSKALLVIVIGFFAFNSQILAQGIESQGFEPLEKFAGGCPEGPPCSKTRGLIMPKPEINSVLGSPVDNEIQTNIENKRDVSTAPVDEKPITNKAGKKAVSKKKQLIKQ